MELTKRFRSRRLEPITQNPTAWRDHFTNDFTPLPPSLAAATAQSSDNEARASLAAHMPALLPAYDALVQSMPGTGPLLALYNLPPFWAGCSVTISQRDGRPVMLRNYDLGIDGVPGVLRHEMLPNGGWISGTAEANWSYLDGLNDRGLAVAITFGGRYVVGDGFAVPTIVRYLLQETGTVAEAIKLLQRIPHRLAQNFLLLDRTGAHAVVYASPDEGVSVADGLVCVTNHQGEVREPKHAAFVQTVERFAFMAKRSGALTLADMLQPPLYRQQYAQWFGTLYSVEFDPVDGVATYAWPGQELRLTPQGQEEALLIRYQER